VPKAGRAVNWRRWGSLDQDIVVLQHWLRHVAEAQGSFLFVSIDNEGFHDILFTDFL
jgi:hypothetical protein